MKKVSRLWQADLGVARGYAILSLVLILVIVGWMVYLYYEESRYLQEIRAKPEARDAYDGLASFYWGVGWMKRHQTMFQRLADDADPKSPWPLAKLAWLDHNLSPGRHLSAEGRGWADRALQATHDDAKAWLDLATLYFNLGEFDRATEAANKAFATMPDPEAPLSAQIHFWAGNALRQAGDLQAAEAQFQSGATVVSLAEPYYGSLCQAAVLPVTRELTITLLADVLVVQTRAEAKTSSEDLKDMFTRGNPSFIPRYLAWGLTSIGPRGLWVANGLRTTTVEIESDRVVVSDKGRRIGYDEVWKDAYVPDDGLAFTISALPLISNTVPTTVTVVVSQNVRIVAATPAYRMGKKGIYWRLTGPRHAGQDLRVEVELDRFSQLRIPLFANRRVDWIANTLLWSAPTVLGMAVLVTARRRTADAKTRTDTDRKKCLISWILELVLFVVAGFLTVFLPIWSAIQGYPYAHPMSMLGYLLACVLLAAWLLVYTSDPSRSGEREVVHLGAILFVFYLCPFLAYNLIGPVYLLIGGLVYYGVLLGDRKWLAHLDWTRLSTLFTAKREDIVKRLISLSELSVLDNAIRSRVVALTKEQIKAADYEATKAILEQALEQRKLETDQLRSRLGIGEGESPVQILFRLGPRKTPLGNSLTALGFGLIPYLVFLVLASWSGNVWSSYRGGHDLLAFLDMARDLLLALPWGPLYLLFFGFFFRLLRGNNGTTKGVIFGGVLAVLHALFTWMWRWNQMDLVQLWGTTFRILTTFVFAGIMMDWTTVQFSWRRVRLLYDAPAITTVITMLGTAATTVVAGLLTGKMQEALMVAVQQISESFGSFPR